MFLIKWSLLADSCLSKYILLNHMSDHSKQRSYKNVEHMFSKQVWFWKITHMLHSLLSISKFVLINEIQVDLRSQNKTDCIKNTIQCLRHLTTYWFCSRNCRDSSRNQFWRTVQCQLLSTRKLELICRTRTWQLNCSLSPR